MSNRPARYLRRDWNHKKPHLSKHNSLPILQLTPAERPIFQCEQCGFLNTVIPMCLWCCWTSDAAHEQFYLSAPRARRISAPSRVAWNVAVYKDIATRTPPQAPPVVFAGSHHANANTAEQSLLDRGRNGTTPLDITATGGSKVATATVLTQATTGKGPQSPSSPGRTAHVRLRTSIPSFFLPSQSQQSPSDVDGPTAAMRSMKSLKPSKPSRFSLFLDFNAGKTNHHTHETKMQSDEENVSPVSGERQQRTLRRRRRMNIVEQTTHNSPAASPIAISLNLKDDPHNSRPSSLEQKLSPTSPSRPFPASIEPPHTPPSSTLPLDSPTTPTPVRVGHPNRPYYTAIRKNMSSPSPSSSPPPSRPTSLISSSPSRPESYPPSSFHHRPLSLCLTTTGLFSPFALDNAEDQAIGPESAPAALTGTLSDAFSFPPRPQSSSSTSNTNTNTKPTKKARESVGSCRGSIGFSMSGETELRMALASIGSDSSVGEFRFRETTTPSVTTATTPSGSSSHDHGSVAYVKGVRDKRRGSMSGVVSRVKQFRKSLKDLLVLKSQV